jgi:hypothetical protein
MGKAHGIKMKSQFGKWKVFAVVCHEGQAMCSLRSHIYSLLLL